jgi:hypothetical protein
VTTKIVCKEWLLIPLTVLLLFGCEESKQEKTSMKTTIQNPTLDWKSFKQKKIVFGHQSVGNNILNGIKRLANRDSVKINIQEQRSAPTINGISHFPIGGNGDSLSKIQDFAAAINAGATQGANIAMMKLCYVDFDSTTDAKKVADEYIANLEYLSQKYPNTNFVAITSPLLVAQTGPKAWIKKIIGKQPSGYLDNLRRSEFNMLLRERYSAAGLLFDLARVEAKSNDKDCKLVVNGQEVESLCSELTNDGGHLNERGQELVATAFINFISSFNTKQVAN